MIPAARCCAGALVLCRRQKAVLARTGGRFHAVNVLLTMWEDVISCRDASTHGLAAAHLPRPSVRGGSALLHAGRPGARRRLSAVRLWELLSMTRTDRQ